MALHAEHSAASEVATLTSAEAASLRIIFIGDDSGYLRTVAELSKQGISVERFEAGGARGLADILRLMTQPSGRPEPPRSDRPFIFGRLRLHPDAARAFWNDMDLDLTLGEFKIVHLLASNAGRHQTYRLIYDCLHYEGFVAGNGAAGYRANVRSLIKRIRNKFWAIDPGFDAIENYVSFGYCWKVTA
jgi:two-component system response regulator ChvI